MSNEEIIILKRVEQTDDMKPKGVWKIAHADFMTAMMAFFLIMWLVNATDEEMKRSIANYFNPMNLMDSPTDRRGILDPTQDTPPPASGDNPGRTTGDTPMGADTPGDRGTAAGGGNVEQGNQNRMASAGIEAETDGAAFHDPYAALASSAADMAPEDPVAVDVPRSTIGERGVTAETEDVRDPFDPAYWQTVSPRPARTLRPGPARRTADPPPEARIDAADRRPTEAPRPRAAPQAEPSPEGAEAAAAASPQGSGEAGNSVTPPQADTSQDPGPASPVAEAVLAAFDGEAQGAGAKPGDATPGPSTPATAAAPDTGDESGPASAAGVAEAAEEIRQTLSGLRADVAVTAGQTSVLIALTDDEAFSMFPIGSARPTEDAAALFARVAGALSERQGSIVIRGHTDARPFRDGTSDNWVLSFDRAHATKTALVANGVAPSRIARVEGLADREPSVPEDPLADENRRIEILYEPVSEEAP